MKKNNKTFICVEDVVEKLTRYVATIEGDEFFNAPLKILIRKVCGGLIEYIKVQPVADVEEVVHARWEFKKNAEHSWCTDVVCTACETVIDSHVDNALEYRQEEIRNKLLRCPHCGAKIDS